MARRIGFVDVPGHERLLHTMLAGATGIDHALLVVAADDGVMPQTREHLAVVCAAGRARGDGGHHQIDRIDEGRSRRAARRGMLGRGHAARARRSRARPCWRCRRRPVKASMRCGSGCSTWRARSTRAKTTWRFASPSTAPSRCRASAPWSSGTVFSGTVRIGDELRVVPGDRTVRVRGMACAEPEGRIGARASAVRWRWPASPRTRCIAATGPAHRPSRLPPTASTCSSTLWPDEAKPLRSGATVHAHLGASDVWRRRAARPRCTRARRNGLCSAGAAGKQSAHGMATAACCAMPLRTRTVAGVRVLDPFAPVRYRRTPERLRTLAAWAIDDRDAAWPRCCTTRRWASTSHGWRALSRWPMKVRCRCPATPCASTTRPSRKRIWTCSKNRSPGASRTSIAPRQTKSDPMRAASSGWPGHARTTRCGVTRLDDLVARGALVRSGTWLHLPDHAARLGEAEQKLAQKLLPRLADGGFDPPWVRDLAKDCAVSEPMVRQTLARSRAAWRDLSGGEGLYLSVGDHRAVGGVGARLPRWP